MAPLDNFALLQSNLVGCHLTFVLVATAFDVLLCDWEHGALKLQVALGAVYFLAVNI